MKNHAFHLPGPNECRRRRLAESGIISVDQCSCGAFQLHIGALSLRLDEGTLSEVLATLGLALERALRESKLGGELATPVFGAGEPGEA